MFLRSPPSLDMSRTTAQFQYRPRVPRVAASIAVIQFNWTKATSTTPHAMLKTTVAALPLRLTITPTCPAFTKSSIPWRVARSNMTCLLLTALLLRRTGDISRSARMEHVRISGVMLVFLVVNGRQRCTALPQMWDFSFAEGTVEFNEGCLIPGGSYGLLLDVDWFLWFYFTPWLLWELLYLPDMVNSLETVLSFCSPGCVKNNVCT